MFVCVFFVCHIHPNMNSQVQRQTHKTILDLIWLNVLRNSCTVPYLFISTNILPEHVGRTEPCCTTSQSIGRLRTGGGRARTGKLSCRFLSFSKLPTGGDSATQTRTMYIKTVAIVRRIGSNKYFRGNLDCTIVRASAGMGGILSESVQSLLRMSSLIDLIIFVVL